MKKSFKKITAVLLVTFILAFSLPLQSFALTLTPAIEKIEVSDNSKAVSLKEVDRYFTELIKTLEENEIDLNDLKENMPSLYDALFNFGLYLSCIEYEFDVTLASGKEYTFSTSDYNLELNKIYSVEIDAFITYDSYLAAKEKGADEIQVDISAEVYNNLTADYVIGSEYTSADTMPVTQMYVKSITPVSGVPHKLYYDANYVDIEGAEFMIEYADGETVTATVKANTDDTDEYSRYTLNGEPIYAYYVFTEEEEETEACEFLFEYLDAYYMMPAEYIEESLFKSIKITDYAFDAENAYLSSITYELTYNDDSTVSYTKEFTQEENPLITMSAVINEIEGYEVSILCTLGNLDEESDKINADTYYVNVFVGEVSDTCEIDNPYKDVINGPLNAAYFFINMVIRIQEFFSGILSMLLFGF